MIFTKTPGHKLFQLLDKKCKSRYSHFKKYYAKDSKKFINKIQRDYKEFPGHVLKTIKGIKKSDYDSAVCILRGALPYALLFEADGWNIHYLICGRVNEKVVFDKMMLRFDDTIDPGLAQIKNKRVLIIDNNSFSGNTPVRVALELKNKYDVKKPDLFLDYFCKNNIFESNRKRTNMFGKIIVASNTKVADDEKTALVSEFLAKINNI